MVFEDWYARVRQAVHEYQLDIDSLPYRTFTEFRHHQTVDQDKILEWFRRDFPTFYSLLMELKLFDEQYPNDRPLLEGVK